MNADATPPAVRVLIVCTGNICRSALAERLGRAFLDEVMGERARLIRLESAGTRAVVGSGMHPDSALVLRGLGAEPGDFTARQLVEGMAGASDLVLTMTRGHRREVLHRDPRVLARTFTLREAADLVEKAAPDESSADTDLATRARSLIAEMARLRSQRHSGSDDDIRDPIGESLDVQEEVGLAVTAALLPVLRRIAELDVGRQLPIG